MNPLGIGAMKTFSEAMFGVLSIRFGRWRWWRPSYRWSCGSGEGRRSDRRRCGGGRRRGPGGGVLVTTAVGAGALGLDGIGDPFGVAFLLVVIVGLPATAAVALLTRTASPGSGGGRPDRSCTVDRRAIRWIYAAIVAGSARWSAGVNVQMSSRPSQRPPWRPWRSSRRADARRGSRTG